MPKVGAASALRGAASSLLLKGSILIDRHLGMYGQRLRCDWL